MTSHFDNFQSFFSRPHDPKSEQKIPVNQLIKNSGLRQLFFYRVSNQGKMAAKRFKMYVAKCCHPCKIVFSAFTSVQNFKMMSP